MKRGILALGLGLALCAPLSFVRAEPYGPALNTAIELCLTLPEDGENVEAHLIEAGWKKNHSEKAVFDTMISTHFAFRYSSENAEELGYSFRNSDFMAASALGNSALPPHQPSYSLDDVRLATIGLSLDTPYCLLTGPIRLNSALNIIGISEDNAVESDPRFSQFGEISRVLYTVKFENKDVVVAIVDTDAISEKVAEFSLDQYLEILAVVQEVNIYINPAETSGERYPHE